MSLGYMAAIQLMRACDIGTCCLSVTSVFSFSDLRRMPAELTVDLCFMVPATGLGVRIAQW